LIIYKDLGPNQHQNSQYLHELTIGDLSSQSKARQLRDSLLSEDQMELALDVATRCQIESEPVWTQWGLALLSLGKYKLAREKFKYCTSLSITQKINLLTQILNVLEGGPPVSQIVKRLKERPEPHTPWDDTLLDITMDISDLTKQQRTSPLHTHMDETRMTEAKHYIVSLGNDDVYVLFLVRNGQIEEAVNHVVTKALPAALFVETIASYCLRRGLISYLIRLLGKYPNLNSSYPLAMCKYLNAKGAFHMLYKVQVYLQDHVRAGLTCVRLFINSIGDMQEKLRLLEEAKKHFVQGLSQMQKALQENMRSTGASFVASSSFKLPRSGSVSGGKGTSAGAVLKPEEISKYIKTIDLQSEVTKAQVMNENLFGSPKVKCDIVEAHLGSHFDLAYRIANEYHLPHVKLYARTLCELSKKKQVNVVNDLLNNIRSTPIADDDWDTIVNAIIKVYVTDLGDKAGAEKFIARLKDDSRKVKACLLCERYKAAYLIAVKDDRIQDVKLIYNVTSKLENNKNAQTVADISFKFLQSRGVKV
jgi:zinc finger FYVE domain-containing protein 26